MKLRLPPGRNCRAGKETKFTKYVDHHCSDGISVLHRFDVRVKQPHRYELGEFLFQTTPFIGSLPTRGTTIKWSAPSFLSTKTLATPCTFRHGFHHVMFIWGFPESQGGDFLRNLGNDPQLLGFAGSGICLRGGAWIYESPKTLFELVKDVFLSGPGLLRAESG